MVFTSTYTIIFIQSHILRLKMGSTTFNGTSVSDPSVETVSYNECNKI